MEFRYLMVLILKYLNVSVHNSFSILEVRSYGDKFFLKQQ